MLSRPDNPVTVRRKAQQSMQMIGFEADVLFQCFMKLVCLLTQNAMFLLYCAVYAYNLFKPAYCILQWCTSFSSLVLMLWNICKKSFHNISFSLCLSMFHRSWKQAGCYFTRKLENVNSSFLKTDSGKKIHDNW